MAKKVKFTGAKEIAENMQKVTARLIKKEERAVTHLSLAIGTDAVKNAPSREANLINSKFIASANGIAGEQGTFKGEASGELVSEHAGEKVRASARVKAASIASKVMGVVGFSAFYGFSVHENPTAGAAGYDPALDVPYKKGKRKGKNKIARDVHSSVGGWKFFRNAFNKHKSLALKKMAKEVRFK